MAACPVTPPAADAGDLQRRWADAVKRITAEQPSRGGLLQSSRAVSDDGETLTIGFPQGLDVCAQDDHAPRFEPAGHADHLPGVRKTLGDVCDGRRGEDPCGSGVCFRSDSGTHSRCCTRHSSDHAPCFVARSRRFGPRRGFCPPRPPERAASRRPPLPARLPLRPPRLPCRRHQRFPPPRLYLPPLRLLLPRRRPPRLLPPASVPAAASSSQVEPSPQPSPSAVDQATGPTILSDRDIEADRKAWEDEMPPTTTPLSRRTRAMTRSLPFDVPAEASSVDSSSASAERSVGNSAPAAQTPAAPPQVPRRPQAPRHRCLLSLRAARPFRRRRLRRRTPPRRQPPCLRLRQTPTPRPIPRPSSRASGATWSFVAPVECL